MSERPIQVGDLATLVYSCCDDRLGLIGRIEGFRKGRKWAGDRLLCNVCGVNITPLDMNSAYMGGEYWPLAWLKKIPPSSELKGQRTQETLRLPRKETA